MMDIFSFLLISLIIQIFFFLPAYFKKTDVFTDFSYSLTFIVLVIFALLNNFNLINFILSIMIFLWALRLGIYLGYRIHKIGRDSRFDNIRNNFFKFLGFWVLQGISVFVILLNSFLIFKTPITNFNFWSVIGIFIWLSGFLIESISDLQKFKFKLINKNKWTNIGLWKYSRHPNYFGEILCWWGIFIFSIFYLNLTNSLISLISPLYITILLLFFSGVPLIEKKYDEKYKANKEYQKYKKETNLLFPKLF
jgi:steroid 5-alpha reductase family enzyme